MTILTAIRTAATSALAAKYLAPKGARTMAIDPRTHRIYLPTAEFGPPAPAEPGKKPRPSVVEGSFVLLVVGK